MRAILTLTLILALGTFLGGCNTASSPSSPATPLSTLEGTIQGWQASWTVYVTTQYQIHDSLSVSPSGYFRYPLANVIPQYLAPLEDWLLRDAGCSRPSFNPPGSQGTPLVLVVLQNDVFAGYLLPFNGQNLGLYLYVDRPTQLQGTLSCSQGNLNVSLNFVAGWNYMEVRPLNRQVLSTQPPAGIVWRFAGYQSP